MVFSAAVADRLPRGMRFLSTPARQDAAVGARTLLRVRAGRDTASGGAATAATAPRSGGPWAQSSAYRPARVPGSRRLLVRHDDARAVELQLHHPVFRVAARPRRRQDRVPDREHLLHLERAVERWPGAATPAPRRATHHRAAPA